LIQTGIDRLAGTSLVDEINGQTTKWVAAFVDEGMAGWAMPSRDQGLYQAWRDLTPRDFSGRLLGVARFADKVRGLPAQSEDALVLLLRRLGVPEARWKEYLSRHLAQLPGWAGLIRWLGETPDYPGQTGHQAGPLPYLAIRLFYEAELADVVCRGTWGVPANVTALAGYWHDHVEEYQRRLAPEAHAVDEHVRTACERAWPLFRVAQHLDLTPDEVRGPSSIDVSELLGWLAAFPVDRHGPVWLEAYEDSYRQALLGQLSTTRDTAQDVTARPRAQIVLCIDVRSESFRRHIEARGPLETFGYAGFFGVAMNHEAFDSDERFPLCPVLLKPRHAVDEVVRPDQRLQLQSYASGTRWHQLADHLVPRSETEPGGVADARGRAGLFLQRGSGGEDARAGPLRRPAARRPRMVPSSGGNLLASMEKRVNLDGSRRPVEGRRACVTRRGAVSDHVRLRGGDSCRR
jgi:uncharacterized protein YbcC (UPF0753/DUF2309 family)